ncbi:hypothetical protein F6X40_34625 [Paraburkholderia sp. UCT31]|uniref:hypothetical protein n=1 Tax=Paraburkholderia sp. UCT31 TaxID=2615209 RepID=UPI001655456B|nr:hypothetical protein [Paraburkholderia sp. UCT31]MBC8741699.1 hypothetical protein [Paraburkholderia sp. UCT31]
MDIDVKYDEVSLEDVLAFFAERYKFTDGSRLVEHKAYVDTAKGVVLFRFTTQPPEKRASARA